MPIPISSTGGSPHGAIVPIAQYLGTVTTGGEAIYFTNIPQTYQDLYIVGFTQPVQSTGADTLTFTFNGVSNINMGTTILTSTQTTTTSGRLSNQPVGYPAWYLNKQSAQNPTNFIMHIPNYTNTSTYKLALVKVTQDNNQTGFLTISANSWASTSAITAVTFSTNQGGDYFSKGNKISLYGVRALGQ